MNEQILITLLVKKEKDLKKYRQAKGILKKTEFIILKGWA